MKRLKVSLITVFIIAGLLYAGLAYYYSSFSRSFNSEEKGKSYLCGTVINGIYCTGMTPEQVNNLLLEDYRIEPVQLITRDGDYIINPEEINYSIDFSVPLNDVLKTQNPLLWVKYVLRDNVHEINPIVSFDEEFFATKLDSLGIVDDTSAKAQVKIRLTEDGYTLEDNSEPSIDYERLKSDLISFVKDGNAFFEVDDSYYSQYVYSQTEIDLMDYYEKIKSMQERRVAYYFGSEKKTISAYDWAGKRPYVLTYLSFQLETSL